jgi:hypothetical protein
MFLLRVRSVIFFLIAIMLLISSSLNQPYFVFAATNSFGTGYFKQQYIQQVKDANKVRVDNNNILPVIDLFEPDSTDQFSLKGDTIRNGNASAANQTKGSDTGVLPNAQSNANNTGANQTKGSNTGVLPNAQPNKPAEARNQSGTTISFTEKSFTTKTITAKGATIITTTTIGNGGSTVTTTKSGTKSGTTTAITATNQSGALSTTLNITDALK